MAAKKESKSFIEQIIHGDINSGKHEGRVHTRFPPEPNGYLHVGHALAITLNFELAAKYGGTTNLRFDDTNPTAEKQEYVDAIKKDIKWLGFDWGEQLYFTSDYFDELYAFALKLIRNDKAYVDDSSAEKIVEMKGTPHTPGVPGEYRSRSIEENLDLFQRMKAGEFEDGSRVLRAKIDLAHDNLNMRDPIIYRIKRATHHRTGDRWCIYPMYDFAHGQSDSLEKITHSLCSLEFENHRPLYDWLIANLEIFPTRQIEFARLNLNYTVMSKRRLKRLVEENYVASWDDPRMPTLSAMRRRGYPPEAIRKFVLKSGITKRNKVNDIALLEHSVREELNLIADRAMVVIDPLKLVITNYPEGKTELMPSVNNPESEDGTVHHMPFSKELYIEKGDFMVDPPKKFFRLGPDRTVRLKYGFIISYESHDEDANGNVSELRCKYFENSRSGSDESGIKAKGTLHWVSANTAVPIEVRFYDRLFNDPDPMGHEGKDFTEFINPDSLKIVETAVAEPFLKGAEPGKSYQFFRKGYFTLDPDTTENKLIFNQTVALRDSWAKKSGK